ncbi:MAG: family 10 glycosylhydrolase [Verrucomicrobiales bacterium]|nr:family 10 glycosylhydrolase [Verrucomicrobiales bacterium]
MKSNFFACLLAAFSSTVVGQYKPVNAQPPEPMREFRGAWVATVHNINWPSKAGLPPSQQRAELIKIFDLAAATGLNGIIFQVRPEGDALYRSEIEPWSYWLTGQMGQGPADGYDPLEFAIEEAHKRGLELHAWFNPFRARATNRTTASRTHMSKTNPEWMLPSGTQMWANPGIRAVQDRAIAVMTDVTRRYDVDGIHIDDYFYPYPKKQGKRMVPQFDDSATYAAYRQAGGRLKIEDWRRAEIDGFIQRLYASIKQTNREVKFGISPFGIWRPRHPITIEADLDSFAHISADSKKWLQNGWLDYFSPQLYWRIDDKPHSFLTLTKWWESQNNAGRHLWPGTASDRIAAESARTAKEAAGQIEIARQHGANKFGSGHIHWSFGAIAKNSEGLRDVLASVYETPAIPPATPWLASPTPPSGPQVQIEAKGSGLNLNFKPSPDARWRLIQYREKSGGAWRQLRLQPAEAETVSLKSAPAVIAVRNVDRTGRLSAPTVLGR